MTLSIFKYGKPAGILAIVFAAGMIGGYFTREALIPQDVGAPKLANPLIQQFFGMLIFDQLGEDDAFMPDFDGRFEKRVMHTSLGDLKRNFTTVARHSTYYLSRTLVDWNWNLRTIPTTMNVSYVNISVDSREICDLAIVCEETIANETGTMHRIQTIERPMGLDFAGGAMYTVGAGALSLLRDGDNFYIPSNYSAWAAFSPHSVFDDLNITYTYRLEIFHAVGGNPELMVSVEMPALFIQIWDDPMYISGGIERDLTITTYSSYYTIVDTAGIYPTVFGENLPYTYGLGPVYTPH